MIICMCINFKVSDAELKQLFSGHLDVFGEVRDKMSLSPTEVGLISAANT